MTTTFDAWLQIHAAARKGGSALSLIDVPPATRGLRWQMTVSLAGNWTTGTLSGSVSASPDAASPLVTFGVTSPSYDGGTGKTTWTISLSAGTGANSTGILPSDTDGDGQEAFPMAVYLTPSGGSQELVFAAALYVSGKV